MPELQQFIARFDSFLIDLWGVLWDGRHVFEGAIDFCHRLFDAGKGVYFLSNTAEFPVEELIGRFRDAGLTEVGPDRLITSGQAMELWFRQNGYPGRPVYVFGGAGNRENIRRAGATPIDLPDDVLTMADAAQSDCLVLGGIHHFTWKRMEDVVTAVGLGRLRVLCPNPDVIVMSQKGEATLPAGMIAHVIEKARPQAEIVRLGKPFPFIYEYAFERMGGAVDRSRVCMIGDSMETDVRGANNAGIASLLLGQSVHMGLSLDEIRQQATAAGIHLDYFTPRLAPDQSILKLERRPVAAKV